MIKVNVEGKVVYKAVKPKCLSFPILGNERLKAGTPRNFQVFGPLEFLAEVIQHIPNKGEHQIRYYGWYSNTSSRIVYDKSRRFFSTCLKPQDRYF